MKSNIERMSTNQLTHAFFSSYAVVFYLCSVAQAFPILVVHTSYGFLPVLCISRLSSLPFLEWSCKNNTKENLFFWFISVQLFMMRRIKVYIYNNKNTHIIIGGRGWTLTLAGGFSYASLSPFWQSWPPCTLNKSFPLIFSVFLGLFALPSFCGDVRQPRCLP